MPVILDDEMLIPPSMRRKHYLERDRLIEVSSSSSTIELPPHRREYERSRSPLVIHQERIIPVGPTEVEIIRDREFLVEPAGQHGRSRRHYRGSASLGGSEIVFEHRGRARSAGYDSGDSYCSTCEETETYYLEDGSTGRRRRRLEGALAHHHSPHRLHERREGHTGRHLMEAGAGALGARQLYNHRRRRSTSASSSDTENRRSHHGLRRTAETGLGAVGAHRLYERHRSHERHPEHDPHRRARHLAEAGLGIAAAGAAKEVYDVRKRRARSRASQRSRSSSTSSDEHGRHTGRHVAAAALGATAAGLAAHKVNEHYGRRRQSRGSFSSASSDDEHSHHHGRKVAAGLAGATAAGLAAKAIHDRRARSRARSSSTSSSDRGHSHKLRNAALGATAAGLVAHKLHSRSRSRSRPAGILRRPRRSSSTSSTTSTSSDSSSHKLRNTALGLAAGGLAAHELRKHTKEHRRQSRSPSRPGILRRRSRTVSPPRHGGQLATAAAATMTGALAEREHRKRKEEKRRSSSVDARKGIHYPSGGYVDDESMRSGSSSGGRRGSGIGNMLRSVVSPNSSASNQGGIRDHGRPRAGSGGGTMRNAMAQEVAYRVGEGVAEGLRRAGTTRR